MITSIHGTGPYSWDCFIQCLSSRKSNSEVFQISIQRIFNKYKTTSRLVKPRLLRFCSILYVLLLIVLKTLPILTGILTLSVALAARQTKMIGYHGKARQYGVIGCLHLAVGPGVFVVISTGALVEVIMIKSTILVTSSSGMTTVTGRLSTI